MRNHIVALGTLAALGALVFLASCGSSGSAPVSRADIAALETSVQIAETLALNYTSLPACPAAKVCADPARKIRIKAAGARAHAAAVRVRTSSAPADYTAAAEALAALEAITPAK